MRCWPVCCAAAIAGGACTSPTAARPGTACDIIAAARISTTERSAASRLAGCGSTRPYRRNCCECLHLWGSRPLCMRSMPVRSTIPRSIGKPNSPSLRRATTLGRPGATSDLVVHWQGGDHTQLTVPKNRAGRHRWTTEAETGELIRALARQQPDAGIAAILNRCGKCTGKGNSWTESRVRSHRSAHGIAVYRDGEMAERGELMLEEAARRLTVSKMTVLRLIGR